jgi:hypothetical protein
MQTTIRIAASLSDRRLEQSREPSPLGSKLVMPSLLFACATVADQHIREKHKSGENQRFDGTGLQMFTRHPDTRTSIPQCSISLWLVTRAEF